jgi:hypothetical protein
MRVAALACAVAIAAGALAGPAPGPLHVSRKNPRYFADPQGNVVYLTGSHVWNNLVDMGPSDPPPAFDFPAYLDWMRGLGHNFIRLWTWELVMWNTGGNSPRHRKAPKTHTVRPHPFARSGPGTALDGKPKFDLTQYDQAYFTRLRQRVAEAGRRGIYVSVMLFEGWGLQRIPGAFKHHPFHPRNNTAGLDGDANGDGKGLEVHTLTTPAVTAIQEAYVKKVIDTVNDLDNVLYEISNENHPASTAWQYHMIEVIHAYEKTKPKQHPVGMTFQFRGGSNADLFKSPAEWISPNAQGGYRDNPPDGGGKKVILSDTDHLWGIGGNQPWVWKSFCRGLNPIFMDPYDGLILGNRFDPRWDPIRRSMGYARRVAARVDLRRVVPRPKLASTGYCLAEPGRSYVVYNPAADAPSFTLTLERGLYGFEWFDPGTGAFRKKSILTARGGSQTFTAPFRGEAVLLVRSAAGNRK